MLQTPKEPYPIRYVRFDHVNPFGETLMHFRGWKEAPLSTFVQFAEISWCGGVGLREMFGMALGLSRCRD